MMKDYHAHHPCPHGGYICASTREDWARIAATDGMATADVAGIGLFEAAGLLATEIPSRACGT